MLDLRSTQRAFTLVELLVGLSVLGFLATMAVPNFMSWVQNLQIRNAAESILNGLQLAKAEAVKRNNAVDFILTTAIPTAGNVDAATSATGTNWIVRQNNQPAVPVINGYIFIQGRIVTDGSKNATVTANPAVASFTFTPLGRLVNPLGDVNIEVSSATNFANRRPMRVIVTTGGLIRMCDPNGPTGTSPQFC